MEMKRIAIALALSASLIAAGLAASARAADAPKGAPSATAALSSGEVTKVDKGAGKITIKHGPLANLEMPGMTMAFRVKDPAMLDQVKPGDKVKFEAEKIGGAFTVTKIEQAK